MIELEVAEASGRGSRSWGANVVVPLETFTKPLMWLGISQIDAVSPGPLRRTKYNRIGAVGKS